MKAGDAKQTAVSHDGLQDGCTHLEGSHEDGVSTLTRHFGDTDLDGEDITLLVQGKHLRIASVAMQSHQPSWQHNSTFNAKIVQPLSKFFMIVLYCSSQGK